MFHNSNVFGSCIIHILYIYSTNIGTEYFKHGIYSPFFFLKNADCFIILTYLVPVLFTFYTQCAKIKKKSVSKRLRWTWSTGAMTLTKETEVPGAKPVPLPLCSPQILLWMVWAVTWVATVTGRWITTEPCHDLLKTGFNQSNRQSFGSYVRDNTDLLSYKTEQIHKVSENT